MQRKNDQFHSSHKYRDAFGAFHYKGCEKEMCACDESCKTKIYDQPPSQLFNVSRAEFDALVKKVNKLIYGKKK